MTKKCSKCGGVKGVGEFHWDRTHNRYKSQCRICVRRANKDWRKKNPEKTKKAVKQFFKNNPDYRKIWYKNNYISTEGRGSIAFRENINYYKDMLIPREITLKSRIRRNVQKNIACKEMKDSYIKRSLKESFKSKYSIKISFKEITTKMIEAKRDVLKVYRLKRRYNERFGFNAKRI